MTVENIQSLLFQAIKTSIKAGKRTLEIYKDTFDIIYKEDKSPLTMADSESNAIIVSDLKAFELPILSEECKVESYDSRRNWSKLWVIDPLDGTKEFINKNGEFTINIALVEYQKPILGVIYAPVLDILYFGYDQNGAYKLTKASSKIENLNNVLTHSLPLPCQRSERPFTVVVSRSHLNEATKSYIQKLEEQHKNIKTTSIGSSLKICLIAEGVADLYPRLAPTYEWDTAAGHAIVNAAGGKIVYAENTEKEIYYNKKNILNPGFIVLRNSF